MRRKQEAHNIWKAPEGIFMEKSKLRRTQYLQWSGLIEKIWSFSSWRWTMRGHGATVPSWNFEVKIFLYNDSGSHFSSFLREAVESLCFEIFQARLNKAVNILTYVWNQPWFEQGLDYMTFRGFFVPELFYDSVSLENLMH